MSISLLGGVRGFVFHGLCLSNSPCSSLLFNKLNLCVFRNRVYENLLQRELHSAFILSKNVELNLTDSTAKAKSKDKPEVKTEVKKKKEKKIYITLIGVDDKITVTTVEDALKISNRRDLKLIKVNDYDTKSQRPVYKLMTTSHYIKEETEGKKKKEVKKDSFLKGEKLISLSQKINEHDLNASINKIIKWIEKRNEVRIVITGDDPNSREAVYKAIESSLNDKSRVVQKREKQSDLRFHLLPLKKEVSSPS